MGTIKDIVDLSTQLANSVSDRKITADLNRIQSLTLQLQAEEADLHETNMKLREELLEVKTENNKLAAKIDQNNSWEEQLVEYELVTTEGRATVYQFKGNPVHYACPSCISKKQIQILQDGRNIAGSFKCPGCEVVFPVNPAKRKSPPKVRSSRNPLRY
ncbi:MAG: hypothetical protein GY699_16825 [Desulfobacteraceae bacterium]|nr:hypothetical protein [Desulfobacteraceae bacterium]